jgi:hypothetical protein
MTSPVPVAGYNYYAVFKSMKEKSEFPAVPAGNQPTEKYK